MTGLRSQLVVDMCETSVCTQIFHELKSNASLTSITLHLKNSFDTDGTDCVRTIAEGIAVSTSLTKVLAFDCTPLS